MRGGIALPRMLEAARFGLLLMAFAVMACGCGVGQASSAAMSAFDGYVRLVEARLAERHREGAGLLAGLDASEGVQARVRRGELVVEDLTPGGGLGVAGGSALLHHWRGTAFAEGATAADFERVMRDFDGYPRTFAPQVIRASAVAQDGDRMEAAMRIRQRHGITVVMDATYDVEFGRVDTLRGYSVSRSTRIAEIDGAGTGKERALTAGEAHGFLWRMNTYWSYEERDGGLYVQVESVTMSRGIPVGLGWLVRPFVESIPRESVEFTLRCVCVAVRK